MLAKSALRMSCAAIGALLALLATASGSAAAQAITAASPPALSGPALVAALRQGGLTLYFRHTATDFGRDDRNFVEGDCSTQRPLTDAGRADARAIGAQLRRLAIPVGDVLASPYCRTMETARLMLGRATATPAVRGGPAQADADRYADLKRLLATRPAAGTVRVISSHGNPFVAVAGPPYLAEGEAAVVVPASGGQFTILARIPKDAWTTLGR